MPWLLVREQITEAQGAFRSHRTWLRAFAQAAGFDYVGSGSATLTTLRDSVVQAEAYAQLAERASPSVGQIRTSLAHAWGTELLLNLSGRYASEDGLKRLTINWGVVQLYYALYHATQAAFVAETGQDRPEDHGATRRIFTDRWCTRVGAPAFLALAFGPDGPLNAPAGSRSTSASTPGARATTRRAGATRCLRCGQPAETTLRVQSRGSGLRSRRLCAESGSARRRRGTHMGVRRAPSRCFVCRY